MDNEFCLRIDLPIPAILNPNRNRTGYANRWQVRDAKADLWSATAAAIQNARVEADDWREPIYSIPVIATLTIYRKRNAKEWDNDNVIAATKQGIWDTLQKEGVLANDKLIEEIKVRWEVDRTSLGYMTVELTPVREGK